MKVFRSTILFCLLSITLCGNGYAGAKWPEATESVSQAVSQPMNVPVDPAFQAKMDQLMNNSQDWTSLSQMEKLQAVQFIIEFFKAKQNTAILKSANFYAQKIDESFSLDPGMMSLPFPIAIKVLSVMEYDFYNGEDKDKLATETLGPQLSEQIKQRRRELGL